LQTKFCETDPGLGKRCENQFTQVLRVLFCLPDLWMSAVSLSDPLSSGKWTGGDFWWAWRVLSTPYSPAADQTERERRRGEWWRGDKRAQKINAMQWM